MMKRLILVLAVTAMMVLGSALPALAYHSEGNPGEHEEETEQPRDPQCGWYANWNDEEEWWEYWCYWPQWGWDYVFWTY